MVKNSLSSLMPYSFLPDYFSLDLSAHMDKLLTKDLSGFNF